MYYGEEASERQALFIPSYQPKRPTGYEGRQEKLEPQTEAETEEKANTHSLSACKYSFIGRLLEMAGQSRGALCILDTVLRLRREIWTAGIHSLGGSLPQKANAYAIEGIMLSAASAYDIWYSVWLLQ